MRRLATLAALVLLAAVTACKVVPASPDEPSTTTTRDAATGVLGDTVRVPVGKRVTFDDGRFVLGFEAVDADSRCPADAICVWQGDAEARFRLTADGRRAGTTLHTSGEPKSIEYAGYRIHLVNVEPYPGTYDRSQPAPPAVAVVVVSRG
jgi:hypothetical protein